MKNIVLGVTGGIAAYKSAALTSQLVQAGWSVRVIMTENAQEFVTPLTFQTLSQNPVATNMFAEHDWRPEHVAIADWAEIAVVAPATANIIGKFANGIADDALSTFLITFRGKVVLAPAMNPAMYASPAVRRNLEVLAQRGVEFVGPESGHVACGEPGAGRMSSPDDIFARIEELSAIS